LLVGIELGHVADDDGNRRRADGAGQQFVGTGLPLIDGNAERQIESDHFCAGLPGGTDGIGVMLIPEHPQFGKGVHGFLVGRQQHDVGNGRSAAQEITHHEMRVIGFEVKDSKEADIAQQGRAQRASHRENGAEGPVPPLFLHVNLHLTTTVRPSLFRVTKTILSLRVFLLFLLCAAAARSQTTQGLISGQLVDSVTGRPIAAANVIFASATSNLAGGAASDASGYYYLPLLSPGIYQIRVTAPAYQSQEVQELELTVAARIELDFRLRPLSDVWEAGEYKSVFLPGQKTIVTFYGPDVDPSKSGSFEAQKGRREPLESTVSEVIDSGEIDNLPLEGRDVYSLLVTQPGVTSDSAT
jgi:hypothetical protein